MGKIRGGESLTEVPKILHYGFRAGLFPVQYYNRFGTDCPVLKKVYSD